MKKLTRTLTRKLRPRRLLVIALCAGVLVGAFFVLTGGEDEPSSSATATATAPRPAGDDGAPARRAGATGTKRARSKARQARDRARPAASPTVTFGSDRAVRNYALAQAIGSIKRPARVSMRVGAAPKQPVSINWNVVCLFAGGAKTTSNTLTLTPPVVVPLRLPPGKAMTCTVSGQAQLTLAGVGRVKVFLLAQRRPGS